MTATALLVYGNEEYLRARATTTFLDAVRTVEPDLSMRAVEADELTAEQVEEHLSPELFGGMPVLTINTGNRLTKAALAAVLKAVDSPDCVVIVDIPKPADAGGKAVITALTSSGAQVENVALSSKAWEKAKQVETFATKELQQAGLRVGPGAVAALVDGEADLRGIATRITQLAVDHTDATGTPATITAADVAAVATTAAVTGFVVSDALVSRDPRAIATSLRDALAAGAAPLFIQAACLSALRNIAAIRTGKTPRLPPAKARDMQRAANQWNDARLAIAIHEMGVIGETVRSSVKTENDLLAALLRAVA